MKLVKDDPPDLEVLVVDRGSRAFAVTGLEITQHGKSSKSLFAVIGKKLANRYRKETILAVLVEEVERFEVAELDEFIRQNNPHGQRVVVIGGTGQAGRFLAVPLDEVSYPEPGAADWKEIEVDKGDGNTGFRGYKGVFLETNHLGRSLQMPLFVKEVELKR